MDPKPVNEAPATDAEGPDNVVLLRPSAEIAAQRDFSPDEETTQVIRRLRELLLMSLLRPRDDLDHACILIAAEPSVSAERYAAAFFHGLEGFARRQLRFYTGRTKRASDDEMWLARLIEAIQAQDDINTNYLLALRVEPRGRRRLLFLVRGLAEALAAEKKAVRGSESPHEQA